MPLEFDPAYFGAVESDLKRKSGYSNYLELNTNWVQRKRIKDFLTHHNISKNSKILELGSAVGFTGKVAQEEGYTNWICVDSSSWCKQNEVYPVIEQDALSYLQSQSNNSYDYIISFGFLECFDDVKLQALIILMNRVAKKQIHCMYREGNSQWYNIKTIPQWKSLFDDSATIEGYLG